MELFAIITKVCYNGTYLSYSLICDLFRVNIFKPEGLLSHITMLVVAFVTELQKSMTHKDC